jgi:hypothetical protein
MISPFLAIALVWQSGTAVAQEHVFAHPAAGPRGNTEFTSISAGKATGAWDNPDSGTTGSFIYDIATGMTTPINFPGAEQTLVTGISGNRLTGYLYRMTPTGDYHGFVYDGMNWNEFDVPVPAGAHVNTYPRAVLPDGTVLGSFGAGINHTSFVRSPDGAFALLRAPGSDDTRVYGGDGERVVGAYHEAPNVSRGFLYDGTTWTSISYPGAAITNARGIDGDLVVGDFYEQVGSGRYRGLLYDVPSGTLTPFDMPGDGFTSLSAVDGNTVVGWFDVVGDTGGARAFVATIPEPGVVSVFAIAAPLSLNRARRKR